MANLTIVYWRDIPAQVIVKKGRKDQAKRELDARFQEAIDKAAMRGKAADTDSYLSDWRRGEPTPCGDDLEAEATAAEAQIEADYPEERIKALVSNGGSEADA